MVHANFVHLRVHSAFSLLEGAIQPDELASLCRKDRMPAVAVTDTNNLFGLLDIAESLTKAGVQPIVGCQLTLQTESPDSPRSNYKAAWDAFLWHIDIPPRNIHPVRTAHASAAESAADYENEIVAFFGGPKNTPRFDLVLLGLGNDGHSASLFPGSPVLKEGARWVAAAEGPGGEPRITFTYPLINAASCVAFLVSGAEKSKVLRAAIRSEGGHPACGVKPSTGTLAWFVDADAALKASHITSYGRAKSDLADSKLKR